MHPKTDSHVWSLGKRLTYALGMPLFILFIISILLDYKIAHNTVGNTYDTTLADTLIDLEDHLFVSNQIDNSIFNQEINSFNKNNSPDTIYYALRNQEGVTLWGNDQLPKVQLTEDQEIHFGNGLYQKKNVRMAWKQIQNISPNLYLQIAETTQKRQRASQLFLAAMITPNLIVILAILIIVYFGIRHGLKPLRIIEKEIESRSINDLREINLHQAPSEIHPMLQRLNTLFSLLSEATTRQQRFIADAAHQLRTPLTAIQTQLDLIIAENTFANNSERISQMEESTTRVVRLLNQLLTYAKSENVQNLSQTFETVHLEDLVEKAASIFLDAALKKDIDLGFDIETADVQGLPWMLQEALGNLIDNAIRYTPNQGNITVRCGKYFLEVEDNGAGIPLEQQAHIFERFYRLPNSSGDGCGLGLSIVQQICNLHQAELKLSSQEGKGSCFRIEFEHTMH